MDLQQVQNYLSKKGYSKNENGKFIIDISQDTIENWNDILSRDNDQYPFYALKTALDNLVLEYPKILSEKLVDEIIEEQVDDLKVSNVNELTNSINDILKNLIEVVYDLDVVLKQEERVDITIDTGDGGWDYTANTVSPSYSSYNYSLEEVKSVSSMVWLVKQQGHKFSELSYALKNVVKHPDSIENTFIHSVAYEVWHEMCDENQLVFLVKMTVKDILIINSLLRWHKTTKKWGGYLILNPETTTGFYSSWLGSTSLLGIKLEKEVKLPINVISEVVPDSYFDDDSSVYGHSIKKVIDNTEKWNNGRVVYMSLPKHFRLNMETMGLQPIRKNERKDSTLDI